MSGYVGPPAGIGASPLDVTPTPNPLQQYYDQLAALHGVLTPNAPAPNPVGTSSVQTMGMPGAGYDTVVGTRGDGTPIMQSEIDAIHAQRAAGTNLALTTTLGMTGSIADAAQGDLLSWEAPAAEAAKPNPLIAYHGTPHLFEPTPTNPLGAFDLAKLGSGEGAQVYGHGMYVAENPATADSYRAMPHPEGPTFDASSSGGPDKVPVADMSNHLSDLLFDHPDLEHVPPGTFGAVADYITYGLAGGKDAAGLMRYPPPGPVDTPAGRDALRVGLDIMGDMPVDRHVPTVGGKEFDFDDPMHRAAKEVYDAGGDHDAAIDNIDTRLDNSQAQLTPRAFAQREADAMKVKNIIDDGRGSLPEYKPAGHAYEVELNAQPHEFLDWDQPYSKQSPQVQAALKQVGVGPAEPPKVEWQITSGGTHQLMADGRPAGYELRPGGTPGYFDDYQNGRYTGAIPAAVLDKWKAVHADNYLATRPSPDLTGMELYHTLSSKAAGRTVNPGHWAAEYTGDPAAASAQLNAAGVKGVRYLDQGSRFAGKGTSNYVMFNPANMNIIRRYGIGALLGGGGAGALAGAQSRQ